MGSRRQKPSDPAGSKSAQHKSSPLPADPRAGGSSARSLWGGDFRRDSLVAVISVALTAGVSWFIYKDELRQARLDADHSLKQTVIADLAPVLLEVAYLHTFKVWLTVELVADHVGKADADLPANLTDLPKLEELRKAHPIEYQKALDYDLQKTKAMGLLLLVHIHFDERSQNAAGSLTSLFEDFALIDQARQTWTPGEGKEAVNLRLIASTQKEIQAQIQAVLEAVIADLTGKPSVVEMR